MVQPDPAVERYVRHYISQLPPAWLSDARQVHAFDRFLRTRYPQRLGRREVREFLREFLWENLPATLTEAQIDEAVERYMRAFGEPGRDATNPRRRPTPSLGCLRYAGAYLIIAVFVVIVAFVVVLLTADGDFWETEQGRAVMRTAVVFFLAVGAYWWIRFQVRLVFAILRLILMLVMIGAAVWLLADTGVIDIDLSGLLDNARQTLGLT